MNIKNIIKAPISFLFNSLRKKEIIQITLQEVAPNEILKDRVALITGGASGIGHAIAKQFLKSGATVIIAGRNLAKLSEVKEELKVLGTVYTLQLDVTEISSLQEKLNEAIALVKGKNIDILVNNAGISGGELSTATEEEFEKILDTNIKGTFFLSKAFGNYFKENNIKGNILNIASSSSLRPATSAYNISKWGLRGFTLGLARLLIPYGITVNGIAPGPTATPMMMKDPSNNMAKPSSLIKRWIMPEEIANMAVFLVSQMGKSIIGDIIYMTGGAGNLSNEDITYHF